MSSDPNDLPSSDAPPSGPPSDGGNGLLDSGSDGGGGRITDLPIEEELKDSYLVYAMSVIISRALPDVRDGLKPSQRRILVAMSDLNLGPGAARVKCAKISGDTSGNYHPHGESVIYPTLVRMAQEWNMRHVLVDKQGNFGSIAGLPPAAMRYTEARLSPIASMMLDDLRLDTVDYVPTYDEKGTEPTVLPSRFPNLLVNGCSGIAVSMATSIPPHNLREVCDALVRLIDDPGVSIDQILEIIPGPDFPTGGIICGRSGIRRGYHTGRGAVVVRARAKIEQRDKNRYRIVVSEIPFQQVRDRVLERIAALSAADKIKGISEIRDESDLKEPVRIVIEIKRDADPEVVLNQLYQFSPLQDTFSLIMLALVDGKPRELTIKQLLEEFLRHRLTVIRRRTQFLLTKARRRKHVVEGLLLALANIDEIIRIIRTSKDQADAKERLMGVEAPAAMMKKALGDDGFAVFQSERGVADAYALTPIQAEAILRMTLGQLVNLEQERLGGEHRELLAEIGEHLRLLGDDRNMLAIIREELVEMRRRHGDDRRTEISDDEASAVDVEDLITEEMMVVTLSHRGYIKRTATSTYRAQKRGGKGLKGATTEEEDPIAHLFVASTHAYLMFFTNKGQVYWRKVHELPLLNRESKGRALVNLLSLTEGETIADCREVRNFDIPDHYLVMATRKGLVKKTDLQAYRRPMKRGIIAIKLREDDELVDVVVAKAGDELLLATKNGMAIRFREDDLRSLGRNSSGVRGIKLVGDDEVVGMVVADPEATLLTACELGYGKRTNFGPGTLLEGSAPEDGAAEDGAAQDGDGEESVPAAKPVDAAETAEEEEGDGDASSGARYRTQRRGGKGLRDIKTTARNGKVIGIVRVGDDDEVLMMTARGKIQRIAVSDIKVIGRNTQGVRIMTLDESDTLAGIVRVPAEEKNDAELPISPPPGLPSPPPPAEEEEMPEATFGEEEEADE